MKKNGLLLACFLLAILFQNCKKEDPDPLITSISPSTLILDANAGEVLTFIFGARSENGLNRLTISYQEEGSLSKVVKDSVLYGIKGVSYRYEFLIPDKQKDYYFYLNFRIIDNSGLEKNEARKVLVKGKNIPLTEYSGANIYSKASGNADAFDLVQMSPKFSGLSASDILDLQVYSTNDTSSVFTKSLISPAGGQFVVYNGFDYVNATSTTIRDGFNSGQKVDKVSNLESGQIILTKLGRTDTTAFAALKIVEVADLPGTKDDKIVFNVKK